MNQQALKDIMSGKDRSLAANLSRMGLSTLSVGYHAVTSARNVLFNHGLRRPAKLPRPTISIGNITTGGTGKTPMVVAAAKRLIEVGQQPAVLLRGYRADNQTGLSDEAQQLADELGSSVPVMPNPSRAQGAALVIEKYPNTTVFLLDDGFQHRQAHRDLDLVLIDATEPFGYDHLLPRGMLRESLQSLRRADGIIITRCDMINPDALTSLDQQIKKITGRPPIAHTTHSWSGFKHNSQTLPLDHLQAQPVVGVSAIGNPGAFERMLQDTVGRVIKHHRFDDHHPYTHQQLASILNEAHTSGASAVVTTEKDWVKWRPILDEHATDRPNKVPILRPVMGIGFLTGRDAFNTMLNRVFSTGE